MTSPDPDRTDERRGGIVRRVLTGGDPEARLEEILTTRRRELDEHAERLRESIAELERREELLRDSRASVERMLRLGTSELEAREGELSSFLHEITERETSLTLAEQDLERRRQELGAVELKRAAVERRERALDEREGDLAEREEKLAAQLEAVRFRAEETVELAFVPGVEYHLVELDATPIAAGLELEVGDETYSVARIGRSPLPGDARRCAYLVRGNRGREPSSGSS